MAIIRIEPRQELWKEPERRLVESGVCRGIPYEIWRVYTPQPQPDLEELIKQFKGGKSRFLGGKRKWN